MASLLLLAGEYIFLQYFLLFVFKTYFGSERFEVVIPSLKFEGSSADSSFTVCNEFDIHLCRFPILALYFRNLKGKTIFSFF